MFVLMVVYVFLFLKVYFNRKFGILVFLFWVRRKRMKENDFFCLFMIVWVVKGYKEFLFL